MKVSKFVKKSIFFAILLYIILVVNSISFAGTLSSDINAIDENKYPQVKKQIQELQKKHSNYQFQVYYTGIDWTEAVTMEYQGHGSSPKNLFNLAANYKGKWYCPICGSKTYDTGWYCASVEAIEYMMDPRNSLDKTSVYQFKNLEMPDVSSDNIRAVINNKYSSYAYINNDEVINAIVKASSDYKMNGYSILAKIVNEQGAGNSPLIKGQGHNGKYVGVYNFFNVGAYGNGKDTVILNGLKYAQNKGWTTKEKSILGGSEYYKSSYIGKGQNTLYYQRFNVVYTSALFSHQYQQDIMGAQTSATLLKKYYEISSTINSVQHTFIIPLYENMPKEICSRPSTAENSKLEYIPGIVCENKLEVKASPNSKRIISYLNTGEKVKILKQATKKSADGNYWDTIVTDTDGTYGYVRRSGIISALPKYVFDSKYYAEKNQDIVKILGNSEQALITHFLNSGIKEGRKSSPTFCVAEYMKYNQDLIAVYGKDYTAFYNHFVNFGAAEGRRGSDEFDAVFYKYYYDIGNLSNIKLMEHYLNTGIKDGKMGRLDPEIEQIVYDEQVYMACNQDLKSVFGTNPAKYRQHWIQCGINEGRKSSIVFDVEIYKELNQDLVGAIGTSNKAFFEHFIKYRNKWVKKNKFNIWYNNIFKRK